MMKVYELGLETMENGAVVEAVNIALAKVWQDLRDLDKVDDSERLVVLTLTVKPTRDNPDAPLIAAQVKTKLAPYRAIAGTAYLRTGADGKITAQQVDPEQGVLPLGEPAAAPKSVTSFPKEGTNGK